MVDTLDRLLFTAGPVEVRRDVLKAMTKPMITHRSSDYKKLHHSVVERLKELLRTENDIFLIPASSTGAMEAGVRSAVSRNILHLTCGSFAERWVEISRSNGKTATVVSTEWGKAIVPELIGSAADGVEAVAVTHNESSTGVMNPLESIAAHLRKTPDVLLMVDAVTSAFGNIIDMKSVKPDLLLFGTQKALALPPGMAIAVVSERLLERAKGVEDRGRYLDLVEIKEFADRDLVPTTPPISLLYALDYQLDRIKDEGMQKRADRHFRMAEMARKWASDHMSLFSQEGFHSNTITCVNNTSGMDFKQIDEGLAKRGYQIAEGYGKLKSKTFRIGHMGDLTTEEMGGLLDSLTEVTA
ncbi:MAG: alanine--glyoxylate aminotransferase family protein [Thermoplasmata archaeon]|nr:alanine--glyoxylate aminotransferase family protein [Candidatus Sysuiplasma acidicola]